MSNPREQCLGEISLIEQTLEARRVLVELSEQQISNAESERCNKTISQNDICVDKKPVNMNFDDMSNAARYVQAKDMLAQYKDMIMSAKEEDMVKLICSANKMDLVKNLINLILPNEVHKRRAVLRVLKDDLEKLKYHVPKKRIDEFQILMERYSEAKTMETTVIIDPSNYTLFVRMVDDLSKNYEQMMQSLPRLTRWRYQIFGWGEESMSFGLVILVVLILLIFMFSLKEEFYGIKILFPT